MDIPTLKHRAADALSAAPYDPRRLSLLHGGIAQGASLLVTLINFLLTRRIDSTGGLAGIGTRTVLTMVQTLLTIGISVAIPFWELGFVRAGLQLSRREPTRPPVLLEGFRRFGPALRLLLLRSLLCMGVAFLCLQLSSMLYMFSPLSLPFLEAAQPLLDTANPDIAAIEALLPYLYPVYILFGVLLCAILIPLLYRLRLADMAIMDGAPGARAAMKLSSTLMRGNRFRFFRLDLQFWWYYGLLALASAISYGDLLLSNLLPIGGDVSFWLFYIAGAAAQLVVIWRFAPLIHTTYATAYHTLSTPNA